MLRRRRFLTALATLAMFTTAATSVPEDPPIADPCGPFLDDFEGDVTDVHPSTIPSLDICSSWIEGRWTERQEAGAEERWELTGLVLGYEASGPLSARPAGWALLWTFDLNGCYTSVRVAAPTPASTDELVARVRHSCNAPGSFSQPSYEATAPVTYRTDGTTMVLELATADLGPELGALFRLYHRFADPYLQSELGTLFRPQLFGEPVPAPPGVLWDYRWADRDILLTPPG